MAHRFRWLLIAIVVYWLAFAVFAPGVARDPYPKLLLTWSNSCPDAAHPDTLKYCPI